MQACAALRPRSAATIGIIAGSGPEAGIDLWAKVLRAARRQAGPAWRGDLDAPRVVVVSEPRLGLSMELDRHAETVWDSLRATAEQLGSQCDHYAIACNTLNWYAPRLADLDTRGRFLSFQSVLAEALRGRGIDRLALLGAAPVMALGPWSPYRELAARVAVETPSDPAEVQALIYDVKRLGAADPGLGPRFARLLDRIAAPVVLLACTELPLIAAPHPGKQLIDVTELVAEALAARAAAPPG